MLGPDTIIDEENRLVALISQKNDSIVGVQKTIEIQTADKNVHIDLEVFGKKRKSRETQESGTGPQDEAKRERKRRRKEKKEKAKKEPSHVTEKRHKKEKERRGKTTEDTEANSCTLGNSSPSLISQKGQKTEDVYVIEKNKFSGEAIDDHESRADRKLRKREGKKRLKSR